MRSLAILALLVAALACSEAGSTSSSGGLPPIPDVDEPYKSTEPKVDVAAVRENRRLERLARGEIVKARFEGEFVGGGLPGEPTLAIPLSTIDAWFMLQVKVSRIVEGELPDDFSSELVFAVHSPTILFWMNGITLEENQDVPKGLYLFTLWAFPQGGYDLEIEPPKDRRAG